jgi:hypothetical protein
MDDKDRVFLTVVIAAAMVITPLALIEAENGPVEDEFDSFFSGAFGGLFEPQSTNIQNLELSEGAVPINDNFVLSGEVTLVWGQGIEMSVQAKEKPENYVRDSMEQLWSGDGQMTTDWKVEGDGSWYMGKCGYTERGSTQIKKKIPPADGKAELTVRAYADKMAGDAVYEHSGVSVFVKVYLDEEKLIKKKIADTLSEKTNTKTIRFEYPESEPGILKIVQDKQQDYHAWGRSEMWVDDLVITDYLKPDRRVNFTLPSQEAPLPFEVRATPREVGIKKPGDYTLKVWKDGPEQIYGEKDITVLEAVEEPTPPRENVDNDQPSGNEPVDGDQPTDGDGEDEGTQRAAWKQNILVIIAGILALGAAGISAVWVVDR